VISAAFAIVVLLLLGYGYLNGQSNATGYNADSATASTGNQQNETGVVVSNSDQSLTGSFITANPSSWPGAMEAYPNDKVWNICAAVALAEGFDRGTGAAPYDLNNPGDLGPGDENGQVTAGPPQQHDGSSIICFATCEGGFIALYTKFWRIVVNQSHVYPASWTWAQVAAKYAGDSANWLRNVTTYLGVDATTTPQQYVNS
jgi:hypothetical protein